MPHPTGDPLPVAARRFAPPPRPSRLNWQTLRGIPKSPESTALSKELRTEFREDVWRQLARGIRFVQGDFDDVASKSVSDSTYSSFGSSSRSPTRPV